MTKQILTVLFVFTLVPVLLFSQEQPTSVKAPLILDNNLSDVSSVLGTDVPVTAANYVAVDTMHNTFSPASPTLNPLVVDEVSNVIAVVHRGNGRTYAQGSGELWWNYSTDNGASWVRSTTSVQNNITAQILARYPSMAIVNASSSTNLGDLWGAFSWPELNANPVQFEHIGYGVAPGMEISQFAAILNSPPNYSSNVPTFTDHQYVYWISDNQDDASIRLFRTDDFTSVDIIDPPTWSSARFGDNGNITMGGVAYDGVLYTGTTGSFTEEIGINGWEPGYSKSTDMGTTWSDWFVIDWTQIPATANYQLLWDWKKGDGFVSYAGDIQVDADGLVHIICGLSDTTNSGGTEFHENAIVEFYETAEGVWDAKILADETIVHDNSFYETPNDAGGNAQDPAVGQCGPSYTLSANVDRDFLVAQWVIGSPEAGDTLCDLYYQTRELVDPVGDGEWSDRVNLTATDGMNEDGAHAAPFLLTTNDGVNITDHLVSMFWYEAGNTGYLISSLEPTVVYVAAEPVRVTPIVSVDNDVTVYSYELEQNYPNPFNPSTSIKYSLAERSNVIIKVYNVLGKEVATILNTTQDAGSYEAEFDASNLASGLYVYTLNAGNFTSSKKMMLLK